ncbi:MAG: hypothetical protein U5R48_08090 [Gammaproteobacteria bacterium]|nr:hypothetical protein [Gammaproteobacteria bacterium]
MTVVYDSSTNNEQKLAALDARIRLGERTEVTAEVACSRGRDRYRMSPARAWAWQVEAERRDGAASMPEAYAREQQEGFGIGQQCSGPGGTRRFGVGWSAGSGRATSASTAEAFQEDQLVSGSGSTSARRPTPS